MAKAKTKSAQASKASAADSSGAAPTVAPIEPASESEFIAQGGKYVVAIRYLRAEDSTMIEVGEPYQPNSMKRLEAMMANGKVVRVRPPQPRITDDEA